MDKVILHSDCNCFYASVECLYRPEIRNKPVVVGGDEEARHGIVLTKNYIAKAYGIKTGEALWQARQKCPDLVIVPPDYHKYIRFSKMAREIYGEYTDLVESFGLDEAWLDCTASAGLFGGGEEIASAISQRMKRELGISVSIGVSWNKIYAKLGSDYKKPDAITQFTRENYKKLIWPLPVEDLIYVGKATKKRLHLLNIKTIGDLAESNVNILRSHLGKMGEVIYYFARGEDETPVQQIGAEQYIKSIGNSTTTPRDLVNHEDVKAILYLLTESVCARMREHGFQCQTVSIHMRDTDLIGFTRQCRMDLCTDIDDEVAMAAMKLFDSNYTWRKPIRSIGVRVSDFVRGDVAVQLDLMEDVMHREKLRKLDNALDSIRQRFGNKVVQRASMLLDSKLTGLDPKVDHTIFPVSHFK